MVLPLPHSGVSILVPLLRAAARRRFPRKKRGTDRGETGWLERNRSEIPVDFASEYLCPTVSDAIDTQLKIFASRGHDYGRK